MPIFRSLLTGTSSHPASAVPGLSTEPEGVKKLAAKAVSVIALTEEGNNCKTSSMPHQVQGPLFANELAGSSTSSNAGSWH